MTGPGKPQTCSHPINARTLTGVCQAVRIFFPYQFQVYIFIGTLESDLLSQSTPCGTKWILVYLLRLYSTSAEGLVLQPV